MTTTCVDVVTYTHSNSSKIISTRRCYLSERMGHRTGIATRQQIWASDRAKGIIRKRRAETSMYKLQLSIRAILAKGLRILYM